MSVTEKVGEFLNTLTMQYKLRYKWWINAVVMILSVPDCLCWLFYFQNIITFLFEKLSCAFEILIWSNAVDFITKSLGMPYSVVTAQRACSTEMVKNAALYDPSDAVYYSPLLTKCERNNLKEMTHRLIRGFAKLTKSKIKLDKAHPTHPRPIQKNFGNPLRTWTEHSNRNN